MMSDWAERECSENGAWGMRMINFSLRQNSDKVEARTGIEII